MASESGPVLQARGRGAAGTLYRYIVILHTHRCDIGNDMEVFLSRYPYIPIFFVSQYFLQYWDHIGPDIGENPDIGFGKERVCPDIDPIS